MKHTDRGTVQTKDGIRDMTGDDKGDLGLAPGPQLPSHPLFLLWKDTTGTIDDIWIVTAQTGPKSVINIQSVGFDSGTVMI